MMDLAKHTLTMSLVVLFLLAGFTSAPANAQSELLPEQRGTVCDDEDEPLDPDSSEARRLLRSEDTNEQGCAELRIQLWKQAEGTAPFARERKLRPVELNSSTGDRLALQLQLIPLLQQLVSLLLQQTLVR